MLTESVMIRCLALLSKILRPLGRVVRLKQSGPSGVPQMETGPGTWWWVGGACESRYLGVGQKEENSRRVRGGR